MSYRPIEVSPQDQRDMLVASEIAVGGSGSKWFECSPSQHLQIMLEGGILAVEEYVRSEQGNGSFITVTNVGLIAEIGECLVSKDTMLLAPKKMLRHFDNPEGLSSEELMAEHSKDMAERLAKAQQELGEDAPHDEITQRAEAIRRERDGEQDTPLPDEEDLFEQLSYSTWQAEQDFRRILEITRWLLPEQALAKAEYIH